MLRLIIRHDITEPPNCP